MQKLDVSHNGLTLLPGECLAKLRQLRELHASANELRDLPNEITHLPQLFVLAAAVLTTGVGMLYEAIGVL